MKKNYKDKCYFSQQLREMDSIPLELNSRIICLCSRNFQSLRRFSSCCNRMISPIFIPIDSFYDKISRKKIRRLKAIKNLPLIPLDFLLMIRILLSFLKTKWNRQIWLQSHCSKMRFSYLIQSPNFLPWYFIIKYDNSVVLNDNETKKEAWKRQFSIFLIWFPIFLFPIPSIIGLTI